MNIPDRRYHDFVVLTGNRRAAAALPMRYSSMHTPDRFSAIQVAAKELAVPLPATKEILVVDPNASYLNDTQRVLRLLGDVEVCADFTAARSRMIARPPDLLITNLRLQEYNGLHLVHLAKPQTRCIVYSTHEDPVLAREVQAAGAFYERPMRLARALSGYIQGELPAHDRRNPSVVDRRRFPRGGRRSADR